MFQLKDIRNRRKFLGDILRLSRIRLDFLFYFWNSDVIFLSIIRLLYLGSK